MDTLFDYGDYFVATHNRKKIRGQVGLDFQLYNNQAGDETDCAYDDIDWKYQIWLGNNTQETLDRAGVKNFKVVKDKRLIAIIEKDKLPLLDTEAGDWRVRVSKNNFVFGCGEAVLTKKQLEAVAEWKEKYDGVLEDDTDELDSYDINELETYVNSRKDPLWETVEDVMKGVNRHIDRDEFMRISASQVRELLKYMEHVHSKK